METLNLVLSAVSTVGFPIVMCIIIFLYMQKTEENHQKQVDKLTEAISNNTVALTKLSERMGGE